ncbi:helix-turn-helix transcriptional regulator [Microvirga sp. SRT01]|jgi:DNA-binding PadR family transcriptional regulator|uniref:Helix-turn-helix transcriptional regulator n=1 Tax=Sphingomonas longa TaxID=2778730 RepID=A0ABS2D8G2_9SPHN|nr:helix-turn-helix transcriptional regulator [Sphingomonas sp. BT552]MBM6576813.1 helix-turn-helix transcriptional regulator [Sphingomonas sp. BT552]MBR7709858.1 helix-turn-helix transcriptional regulator [Microvirga sp. SRT01]
MARRPHSSKQAHSVFEALIARPEAWRHGYDLLQETQLKSGTLYPLLMRLADDGLLESEWCPPVPPARAPRHAYRLTQAGRAFARSMLAPMNVNGPLSIGATA